MMFSKFSSFSLKTLTILTLSTGIASAVHAEEPASFTPEQKEAIISILEQHLKDKPEIVMNALQLHQENEAKAEEDRAKKSIQDNLANLTSKDLPSAGNPEASITVVEFFDYNCGYCKRALPDIQQTLKDDKDVRFVFLDMPILGPTSRSAAQYALAAKNQGKYFEYHAALMDFRGEKTEEELTKIGTNLGLDLEKLKTDAASADVSKTIEDNMKLASEIGIQGTPAFIVDGVLFRGYLGPDGLAAELKKAREN